MGTFASKLSKMFSLFKDCPARIAMIGLDGAGKKTYLYFSTLKLNTCTFILRDRYNCGSVIHQEYIRAAETVLTRVVLKFTFFVNYNTHVCNHYMILKSELEQVNMFYNITFRLRHDYCIVTG